MSLQELIKQQERFVGQPSKTHKTKEQEPTYNTHLARKPAQQLLIALGGSNESHASLSTTKEALQLSGNRDVPINSFLPKHPGQFTIAGACIDETLKSAKIYVNTDQYAEGLYLSMLNELKTHHSLPKTAYDSHLLSVCHAQKIYSLVNSAPTESEHKVLKAYTTVRTENISTNEKPMLLLSTSKADFTHLKAIDQSPFIKAMYHNLFNAALNEEYKYIVMPASRLDKHGGKPAIYFEALMDVAKEYPLLNIIYHADSHEEEFDSALNKAKLGNIVRTIKDIYFLADLFTQENRPCAIHNPTDSQAIYGLVDIGNFWKSSKLLDRLKSTLSAYISTVSTAILGSYGMNPEAYSRIVERSCTADLVAAKSQAPVIIPEPHSPPAKIAPSLPVAPAAQGMFPPAKEPIVKQPVVAKSVLSPEHIEEINHMIGCLIREIKSSWPYPNKDLKQIKVNALSALISHAQSKDSLAEAIAAVKGDDQYLRALEGRISTRTADLFAKVERACAIEPTVS